MPLYGEAKREYQRNWIARRKFEWFLLNGPCKECGSWQYLELDHIDPRRKVSHSIWSWSEERRNKELEKCQVLCKDCHNRKTKINKEYGIRRSGQDNPNTKLKISEVIELRRLYSTGRYSQLQLAIRFGIGRSSVGHIVRRVRYDYVE